MIWLAMEQPKHETMLVYVWIGFAIAAAWTFITVMKKFE